MSRKKPHNSSEDHEISRVGGRAYGVKHLWTNSLGWNKHWRSERWQWWYQSNILYSTACEQKHLRALQLTITHNHTKLHQLLISDFSVFFLRQTDTQKHRQKKTTAGTQVK